MIQVNTGEEPQKAGIPPLEADAFIEAATTALKPMGAQTMLTDGIADAYRAGEYALAARH